MANAEPKDIHVAAGPCGRNGPLLASRTPLDLFDWSCPTRNRWAIRAPLLEGAVVSFDCLVSQVTEVGTHSVFFCAVEAIRLGSGDDEALIYFRRRYHQTAVRAAAEEE